MYNLIEECNRQKSLTKVAKTSREQAIDKFMTELDILQLIDFSNKTSKNQKISHY